MQRYGVFKFNASIFVNSYVKCMLYNIYLILSAVFKRKSLVFLWLLTLEMLGFICLRQFCL